MFQTLAHNPRSQPPHVPQHPFGYRTLRPWKYATVAATERQVVAPPIWLLVLQPILLCCSLFHCFLFQVRSANFEGFVTSKHSMWLSIFQSVTFHNLRQYMATLSTHTVMTMQLNLGYTIPFKINITFIVNAAILLFWYDDKAGFKRCKTILTSLCTTVCIVTTAL